MIGLIFLCKQQWFHLTHFLEKDDPSCYRTSQSPISHISLTDRSGGELGEKLED